MFQIYTVPINASHFPSKIRVLISRTLLRGGANKTTVCAVLEGADGYQGMDGEGVVGVFDDEVKARIVGRTLKEDIPNALITIFSTTTQEEERL